MQTATAQRLIPDVTVDQNVGPMAERTFRWEMYHAPRSSLLSRLHGQERVEVDLPIVDCTGSSGISPAAEISFLDFEEEAIKGSMLRTGCPVVDFYITEWGVMTGSDIGDQIGGAITLRQNLAACDFTGDIHEGDIRPFAEVVVNETQAILSALEDSLLAAQDFETGWDGYDGIAPTQDAVNDAVSFVQRLPADITPPRPLIASDGEVGVYWKEGKEYIEASFYGDGNIAYFARDKDGNVVTSDERPYSREFVPRDLYEAIEKFSGLP